MAQDSRFIDVTRSFIPVDPNAFPETLHVGSREDGPEARIPSMAYKGYNFLPTAHGYKSYFGIAQTVDINELETRVDHIFLFQSSTYENVFIALTETGIWVKDGGSSGAWEQLHVVEADLDPDVHFDWTYCIIEDEIYCYMQGAADYQKIVSDVASPFVVVTSHVPSFLNMDGQVGIFRAGGRLGFWDTDNSFGWSSIDSFTDFTPSITTLAGNAKFIDLVGKIVAVLPHGDGFVVYATKSILFILADPEKPFQWKPYVIFSNNGIAYAGQATFGNPDTVHFAYTSTGLYKIERGKEEVLVPEVTDYLAAEESPVYLKILEGRYLVLQLMNEDFITGEVQFTEGVVPAVDYYFPGSPLDVDDYVVNESQLTGNSTCATLAKISKGAFATQAPPGDIKPGTTMQPVWTCYIDCDQSNSEITWDNTPVTTLDPAGVEKNHCPNGPVTMAGLTVDGTGPQMREAVGLFNSMEAFVETQLALWEYQDDARQTQLAEMAARSSTGFLVTNSGSPLTADDFSFNKAGIESYPYKFTPAKFDFNACSFWLLRECIEKADLYRIKRNDAIVEDTFEPAVLKGYSDAGWSGSTIIRAATISDTSLAAAQVAAALLGTTISGGPYNFVGPGPDFNAVGNYPDELGAQDLYWNIPIPPYAVAIYKIYERDASKTYTSPNGSARPIVINQQDTAGRYRKTSTMRAYNGYDISEALVPQAAFCKITSYSYTKADNSPGTVAAADACEYGPPTNMRDNGGRPGIPIAKDGQLCGIPFAPVTIPGVPELDVEWPSTTVTIPEGSFLLQQGSAAPIYPDFAGAFVYDLHLKKWGKMLVSHKHLVNYQPINTQARGVVPYESFGITAGVFRSDGLVYLFDKYPVDSWITYGKIGYYRLGKTSCEEVIVHFKEAATGTLEVDASLGGQELTAGFSTAKEFDNELSCTLKGGPVGNWFNITVRGFYDISYMEFRGFKQGRR